MGKMLITIEPGKPVKFEPVGYTDGACREATRPYIEGHKVVDDVPTVGVEQHVSVEEKGRVDA